MSWPWLAIATPFVTLPSSFYDWDNPCNESKRALQPVSSLTLIFSIFALKVTISLQFFQAEKRITGPYKKKKKEKEKRHKQKHNMPTHSLDMSEEYGVEKDTGIGFFQLISY